MNQNSLTIILTGPVSCVYDDFSLYHVSFCLIYCNCFHSTNQIRSMMRLTIMGLTPSLMVCAIFFFDFINPLVVLNNTLVVSVVWGLEFLSRQESSQLMKFLRWSCLYQNELIPDK